ncbi:MAG TPA: hypothetical protein PLG50_11195, partial [bacterium]|nr:hypothetical protein [bacterium]
AVPEPLQAVTRATLPITAIRKEQHGVSLVLQANALEDNLIVLRAAATPKTISAAGRPMVWKVNDGLIRIELGKLVGDAELRMEF